MRMLKRRLAMLLAAAMLFTSLPVMNVAAAEEGAPAVENTAEGGEEKKEAPAEEKNDPAPAEENNEPAPAEENNEPAPAEGSNEPAPAGDNNDPAPAEGSNEPAPAAGENNDVVTPEVEDVTDALEDDVNDEAGDAAVKPQSLKIQLKGQDVDEATVNVGSTITLTAIADPVEADATVEWLSSDTSVATVTEAGVVKGISGGEVTITARSKVKESVTAQVTLTSYAGKWVKVNGKWKFKRPNGKYASNAFVTIDGLTYFLGSDQYMKTGWFKYNKKNYYANKNGEIQKGWLQLTVKENKKSVVRYWYMNPKTGVRTTGWKKIDGKFYYFGSDGKNQKKTGWVKLSKIWYYFEKDEDSHIYAATGWKQVKGKWYYLEPSDKLHGKMKTGWFTETVSTATSASAGASAEDAEGEEAVEAELDLAAADEAAQSGGATTKTYYFNSSGASVTGVQTISKKKYLFVKESDGKGVLAEDGWTSVGTDWYYVNPDTHVVATGRTEIDGTGYYFDTKSGISQTGLIKISKTTGSGKKKKTTTTLYYYKDDGTGKGVLQKDAWCDEGTSHYYAGSDGKLVSGDQEIDGKHYYFDSKTGKAKSGVIKVGSNYYIYVADENGRPARVTDEGKVMYGDTPYYIDSNGAIRTGFITDEEDGATYYYDPSTRKAASGWQKVNKKWYYFDPSNGNKLVTGWFTEPKDVDKEESAKRICYLDPANGGAAVTGKFTDPADGAQYYFNSSCYKMRGVVNVNGEYFAYDNITGKKVLNQAGEWTDPAGNIWTIDDNGKIKNYNKKLGAMDTKAQGESTTSTGWLILANKSTHIMGVYQRVAGRWVRQKTWAFHSADNKIDSKTGKKHWTPECRSNVVRTLAERKANKTIGTNGVIQRDFDGSTGYYCTYIHAGYFIHTRLYSKGSRLKTADYYKENKKPWKNGSQKSPVDPNLNDSKLTGGKNVSHGCVRLNFNNALWVFLNIEKGTRVYTYH